jgi:hypothetical protein
MSKADEMSRRVPSKNDLNTSNFSQGPNLPKKWNIGKGKSHENFFKKEKSAFENDIVNEEFTGG